MRLAAIALVATLGLTACAGQDTSKWPSPETIQIGLTTAEAGYVAYCAAKPDANACSEGSQQKVAIVETAANDALTAYSEAYATGNVTQALLDNLNKAIADVVALIAQFQKKG
jgi:hypothetical protein